MIFLPSIFHCKTKFQNVNFPFFCFGNMFLGYIFCFEKSWSQWLKSWLNNFFIITSFLPVENIKSVWKCKDLKLHRSIMWHFRWSSYYMSHWSYYIDVMVYIMISYGCLFDFSDSNLRFSNYTVWFQRFFLNEMPYDSLTFKRNKVLFSS